MGAILGSVISNLIEVAAFAVIAWAGIVSGKKLASYKAAKTNSAK
jgi:hypothetical protein